MISKMFTSLKNKIKEETGSDVPRRFPPRHHVTASNSSLGSTVSSDMDGNILATPESLQDYTMREKELLQRLEKLTREHGRQLEERDREWQEKVTSLQNNMQAAQEVWCGEAAAARRECREEVRKSAARAEQLLTATNAAARAQDRLDQALEEIESERRGWAQERLRLAAQAEEALHNLSLAEPLNSTIDESGSDGMTSNELALKRKLEEAQLHLHDIKTSWSGQIAALETQVGRLSRQAGEEGAERRRVEKERDALLQRVREKETQLEQAQATLEDKEAKMALLAAEAGEASRSGRVARTEAQEQRQAADSISGKLSDTEKQLTSSQKQLEALISENTSLKKSLEQENKNVKLLKHEVDTLSAEKVESTRHEEELNAIIQQNITQSKNTQIAIETEKNRFNETAKENDLLKEQIDSLKHELNEIHERYDKERRDKDESLMRNAHMSQTLEIYRQEMRQQETEIGDLKGKIKQLENTLSQNIEEQSTIRKLQEAEKLSQVELEKVLNEKETVLASEKQLQDCIKDLNNQLSEKTKNMRILQNRLTDMKKTLQRELRGGQVDPLGSSVVEGSTEDPDVTKKYLKHVLIKFLTSREMEARQLTRAVAALLGLTQQEEAQLRDTLAWRGGLSAWLTPHPRISYT